MRVALDAMGGDAGPGPIVAGAARAVRASRGLRVVLVGDMVELDRYLAACGGPHPRLSISHASQNIADDESPASTLRIQPDARAPLPVRGHGSRVCSAPAWEATAHDRLAQCRR